MKELTAAFPGFSKLLSAADFIIDVIIGGYLLIFYALGIAFILIPSWCYYHPAEAKMYAVNALPLLWYGNDGTRALLGIIVLFLLLIPDTTHNFAKYMFWLLGLVGLAAYIHAIF
ncbi:MAG: hypothetical protein WAK29_12925 [Terriglobales bacterium]